MSRALDLVISPAAPSDIPDLLAIEQAAFVSEDGMLTRRAMRRHIGSRHLFLLARLPDTPLKVLGYILVFIHRKSARVYSLAVDPAYRGRGVATRLVQAALTHIAKLGLFCVNLEVRQSNAGARRIYEALGFRGTGIRPQYYGDGEDAVCMRLVAE